MLDLTLLDLRPVIEGRKRYWPIVINLSNTVFVYAWRLYRIASDENIPEKDFPQQTFNMTIQQSIPSILPTSRLGHSYKIADKIQLDGLGNYWASGPLRKRNVCKKNCINLCQKWKESMHMKFLPNIRKKMIVDTVQKREMSDCSVTALSSLEVLPRFFAETFLSSKERFIITAFTVNKWYTSDRSMSSKVQILTVC